MDNAKLTLENRTMRKVMMRILPIAFFMYVIAYMDRVNIGYAALEMNTRLGITSEIFGIVTGIFFIGYLLFEVPSNMLLERVGARISMTRILVLWGIVAMATGFVQTTNQLYILRFLLGVAEAGCFPGLIFYFTYWFRKKDMAVTLGLFMTAVPISYIIGAPLSTWIMDNIHWLGLDGWRWMFILEGAPALILGIVVFFYLTDRPENAKWLKEDEKQWLISELEKEKVEKKKEKTQKNNHLQALTDPKVLYLGIVLFFYIAGTLGIGYWMPQIIKGFSDTLTNTQIGLVAIIPYIVSGAVMIYWSYRSDHKLERWFHSMTPLFVAAFAFLGSGMFTKQPILAMFFITLAISGMYSFKSPFFALISNIISPAKAAVGFAVINSIGNLGGVVGPYAIGFLKGITGTESSGLYLLSGCMVVSFFMVLILKKENKTKVNFPLSSRPNLK